MAWRIGVHERYAHLIVVEILLAETKGACLPIVIDVGIAFNTRAAAFVNDVVRVDAENAGKDGKLRILQHAETVGASPGIQVGLYDLNSPTACPNDLTILAPAQEHAAV
ncbi:MAG: hypothetical protein IJG50_01990 [Clostridia bacterium]|nr:hypothetical protein [Clostridia bacterium]